MMQKFVLFLLFIVAIWSFWSFLGRNPHWESSTDYLDHVEQVTDTVCQRTLVGIQPYMTPADYLTERHFHEKLNLYFEAARKAGYFTSRTVVILPEYVGTWLVIAGEKTSVAEVETIQAAMQRIVLSNPLKFFRSWISDQGEQDVIAASIFRMKAEEMAKAYTDVFRSLATEYHVTINAGSIVLPDPTIRYRSEIEINTDGPLYNVSFMFYSNGTIDEQVVRKSFPISSELPFIYAHPIDQLPVYTLPVGRTAVLVCADSWYPESYSKIDSLDADIVLVNSYCAGDETMGKLWKGYDGGTMPDDVDSTDIGTLTEREAWTKYALPGRLKTSKAKVGVNVFLRGELWDLGTDGQPFLVRQHELLTVGESEKAGIWSICF
jgi:predicted amidohydrolase